MTTEAERIAYLPYFEEDCHNDTSFMAQWGETRNFKVSLRIDLGVNFSIGDVGLSSTVSMSIEVAVSFSSYRRVKATNGIQAIHFPYKQSDR